MLQKLWEVEEISVPKLVSEADEFCEQYFADTTRRLSDGRYMVRLPFKSEFPESVTLGPSRTTAMGQYVRLHKSLSKDSDLRKQHDNVLQEYVDLGHMTEAEPFEVIIKNKYFFFYLPLHAVVRPESKTTKLRVVFNASRRTTTQFSLNDVLHKGPTLQSDLLGILLNWRLYKYVFNGDIEKMYRQILVHPDDRQYQRLLFRPQSSSIIKDFELKTVTFGVNCAPFLAIRILRQLAEDYLPQRAPTKFLKLDFLERRQAARRMGYCANCLASTHRLHECKSNEVCHRCGDLQHTLLHAVNNGGRSKSPSNKPKSKVVA
ncbi:uncharacterized protein [Drosophila takahashii]|uniref:uncharacterized protein n=1 Tax=Drosophila takahashii TaxID=29030 RepID=UPI003898D78A